ncbi:MAG: hypothetical protein KDD44_03720, partial [Bdellovibrionales bacterium]|nr:hypothetical protein [Bdellovibrionales bacterium]
MNAKQRVGGRARNYGLAFMLGLPVLLAGTCGAETAAEELGGISSLGSALRGGEQGQENAPLFVKSDTLKLDTKGRQFIYQDNVQADRGDMAITGNLMLQMYTDRNQLLHV